MTAGVGAAGIGGIALDQMGLPLLLVALGVRMGDSGANPLIVMLLFLLRCLVPLLLMLGLSYLLRRLGLIGEQEPPAPGAGTVASPPGQAAKGELHDEQG